MSDGLGGSKVAILIASAGPEQVEFTEIKHEDQNRNS